MFKFNRNFGLPLQTEEKKPLKSSVKRRLWLTLGLTVLLLIVWFGGIAWGEHIFKPMVAYVIMAVYFAAFAAVLVTYIVYNRAFVYKNVTADMLPAEWSAERKQALLDDVRRRAEKSRWLVALIIPFVTVFLADSLYLFLWEPYIAPLLGM